MKIRQLNMRVRHTVRVNRLPVKVLYIRPSYLKPFVNGCNLYMVQWHGSSLTNHRPQIVVVRFLWTADGFLLTGPDFESYSFQLYFCVPVAPNVLFAED